MSREFSDPGSQDILWLTTDPEDELLEGAYKNYLRQVLKEGEIRILIPVGERCFSLSLIDGQDSSAGVYADSAVNTEPISATLTTGSLDPIDNLDDIPVIYTQVGSALIPLVRFHAVWENAFSRKYNRLPVRGLVDLLGRDPQNSAHHNGILYYRAALGYRAMKS